MVEIIIEVNKDNKKIGLRPRPEFYTGKFIHRSVQLILFNSKNQILLQKRSKTKKWYPNLWSYSVSGTVGNESYKKSIMREMREEIGLKIPLRKLFTYSHFSNTDKSIPAVFLGKSDKKIIPDKIEMSKIAWVSPEDLKKDMKLNPKKYTPPFLKGMKIFFSKYYSVVRK